MMFSSSAKVASFSCGCCRRVRATYGYLRYRMLFTSFLQVERMQNFQRTLPAFVYETCRRGIGRRIVHGHPSCHNCHAVSACLYMHYIAINIITWSDNNLTTLSNDCGVLCCCRGLDGVSVVLVFAFFGWLSRRLLVSGSPEDLPGGSFRLPSVNTAVVRSASLVTEGLASPSGSFDIPDKLELSVSPMDMLLSDRLSSIPFVLTSIVTPIASFISRTIAWYVLRAFIAFSNSWKSFLHHSSRRRVARF